MSLKGKISIAVSLLLAFGMGIALDRCLKNFPLLTLDPKVGVIDVANLLVTITIAFMIPNYVTKIIEDKKGIKSFLIDEMKELILLISEIKKIIADSYKKGVFEATDRDRINHIFHDAEVKVNSISQQMEVAFKSSSKDTMEAIKTLLFDYKDYLTGGELMLSSFVKVEDRFYRENGTEYSKIETGLKTIIQKIYKL